MNSPAHQHGRLHELGSAIFLELWKNGAAVVDLRDAVPFGQGHLADSIHIKAKSPDFLDRVLRFTPNEQPMVLIADIHDDANWAYAELTGHRRVAGYVVGLGALDPATIKIVRLPALTPEELFAKTQRAETLHILDVREPAEWQQGSSAGARHIPMNNVLQSVDELPRDKPIAITCAGGQRSSLIASVLLTRGFTNLFNVTGGMKAWNVAKLPVNTDADSDHIDGT